MAYVLRPGLAGIIRNPDGTFSVDYSTPAAPDYSGPANTPLGSSPPLTLPPVQPPTTDCTCINYQCLENGNDCVGAPGSSSPPATAPWTPTQPRTVSPASGPLSDTTMLMIGGAALFVLFLTKVGR